jgi:hypothetical protein
MFNCVVCESGTGYLLGYLDPMLWQLGRVRSKISDSAASASQAIATLIGTYNELVINTKFKKVIQEAILPCWSQFEKLMILDKFGWKGSPEVGTAMLEA